MIITVFGLSVTSCWGNGHATFWRAICAALARDGHRVTFFERDQPFYRSHRDLDELPGHDLRLYGDWADVAAEANDAVASADAALVTSYCPDAQAAADLVRQASGGVRVFYDMDTPVTLDRLERGEPVEYLPEGGLADFDLVLSYAGGPALAALERRLGARRARPLYGCVDADQYLSLPAHATPSAAVTYLGTWAADRAEPFDALLIDAARRRPDLPFLVGGPNYPGAEHWPANVSYHPHVPQPEHRRFYGSGRFTLNLTRGPMRRWGHCPSARLFEAAALGVPVMTDDWPGIHDFFEPHRDVALVGSSDDVLAWADCGEDERRSMARRARERVLDTCTASVRAGQLLAALGEAASPPAPGPGDSGRVAPCGA